MLLPDISGLYPPPRGVQLHPSPPRYLLLLLGRCCCCWHLICAWLLAACWLLLLAACMFGAAGCFCLSACWLLLLAACMLAAAGCWLPAACCLLRFAGVAVWGCWLLLVLKKAYSLESRVVAFPLSISLRSLYRHVPTPQPPRVQIRMHYPLSMQIKR